MGKYQLDHKGQVAVTKFHEKHTPAKFDKKQQLEKISCGVFEKEAKTNR
nr:hypothetical protein [Heyndrickxia oleronia]